MKPSFILCLLLCVACAKPKDGLNGVDGAPGTKGDTGATGPQGPAGSNGHDGNDAAMVPVKLCPGETVYPSVFVEYAFCIDGNLYGTYSANDGFTAMLPPGLYSSNTIGSRCNFEIRPNCVVEAQ